MQSRTSAAADVLSCTDDNLEKVKKVMAEK